MGIFGRKKKQSTSIGSDQGSIFSRISNLLRANINAALDEAEDPEKMLDQFVRDFTANITEAETAVAETIGNLRLMQKDRQDLAEEAETWQTRAVAASNKADALRAKDRQRDADRNDRLAREAITKIQSTKTRLGELDPQIARQDEMVEQLKIGLEGMKSKLSELKTKRSELLARARVAEAQERVVASVTSLNAADPTSELSRFEEGVRKREALAQGRIEIAASSMDNQYAELEADISRVEADDILASIKSGNTAALSIEAPTSENQKG